MRTIMTIPLALLPVQDQGGGQHAFCYRLHKVKVDLVRRLIIPVISFSVGRVITFWAIQGEGYSFFLQEIEGGHKNILLGKKKLHQALTPSNK